MPSWNSIIARSLFLYNNDSYQLTWYRQPPVWKPNLTKIKRRILWICLVLKFHYSVRVVLFVYAILCWISIWVFALNCIALLSLFVISLFYTSIYSFLFTVSTFSFSQWHSVCYTRSWQVSIYRRSYSHLIHHHQTSLCFWHQQNNTAWCKLQASQFSIPQKHLPNRL